MSKFLRESQSGIERVDTEAGIIYGVKVLGPRSRNGRVYEDAAIRKALPLYEGVTVNINHVRNDPTTRAYQERQMQDRWGVLRNVRYKEGSIYADLHYIKSHPMTKQLVEAAQRFPEIFGLSHDAGGDEQLIDGERRVVEMYEVKSVDVVADPATNEGLFESYRPVDPARARAARKKARLSLYETRDGDGDGKINDGKSSEAPAPPKKAKAKSTKAKSPGGTSTKLTKGETDALSKIKSGEFTYYLPHLYSKANNKAFEMLKSKGLITIKSAGEPDERVQRIDLVRTAQLPSKPASASQLPSKLTSDDKIARAQRRVDRYRKMAGKMYDQGNELIDQSNQAWGGQSDKLYSKGNAKFRAGDRIQAKADRVTRAISKVSKPKA